jgi:hypothetical protein
MLLLNRDVQTGTDWQKRRLINKLHVEQSVEVQLDQDNTKVWKLEEELHKDAVYHQFYSTYTACSLTRNLLKCFETSKKGGQIIHTVKYTDDLVLLAMEETLLQGMIDKLT